MMCYVLHTLDFKFGFYIEFQKDVIGSISIYLLVSSENMRLILLNRSNNSISYVGDMKWILPIDIDELV